MNTLKFVAGMVLATAPCGIATIGMMVSIGPIATLGVFVLLALMGLCMWGGYTLLDQAMHQPRS